MDERCIGCIKNHSGCAIKSVATQLNWELLCPCQECVIKIKCTYMCKKRTAILRYSIEGKHDPIRHVFNNW